MGRSRFVPVIGEIRKATEVGCVGTQKYIWLPCSICGQPRWERLYKGMPERDRCGLCARKAKRITVCYNPNPPMIDEVRRAGAIGRKGGAKFIWKACSGCSKERWVFLIKGKPKSDKCISCAAKLHFALLGKTLKSKSYFQYNPILPELGEVRYGGEIGYRGEQYYESYIWVDCLDCGKKRWVRLAHGIPRSLRCVACVRIKSMSPEVKLKIRLALLGRTFSVETRRKMSLARMGKHPTEEARQKMSLSHMGRLHTEKEKEKIGQAHRGHKHSVEHIEKQRLAQIGKHIYTLEKRTRIGERIRKWWEEHPEMAQIKGQNELGAGNPNWRGGIGRLPYSYKFNKQLKDLIRLRDGYTCQLCGMPECENGKQLDNHHIDYDKMNCLPMNLVALCSVCNSKVNFNRGHWTQYFRELLNERQVNPKNLKMLGSFKLTKPVKEVVRQ